MRTPARNNTRAKAVSAGPSPKPRAKNDEDKRLSRNATRQSHGRLFRPGDVIRESGIYEVIHDQAHRTSHEVVMISKDLFPLCDTCDNRVRFRLVRTAPYIFQDLDFDPPQE